MIRHSRIMTLLTLVAPLALTHCNGTGTEMSDGLGSEVAITALSGASNSSEGQIAYGNVEKTEKSFIAKLEGALSPVSNAWAVPSCSWSGLITGCSSNSSSITFDGCSGPLDHAISLEGSLTFAWTGVGCCTSNPLSASSQTPCSYTRRTISGTGKIDPLVSALGSHSVTLNTEEQSGYNQPKSGGFTVICQGSNGNNTCEGQREILINGAHYTGRVGRALWDHTVSTDDPLVVQGQGSNRRTLSGSIRVQHNLLQYTSVTTILNTLTHSSKCCYPTGGSVKTTFSGGSLDGKTETLEFGPRCGEATLNDTSQKQTGLTLRHCL